MAGTVTVKFPGMRPAIVARAAELSITGEAAWAERERQAEDNLAEAARLLDAIRPAALEAVAR